MKVEIEKYYFLLQTSKGGSVEKLLYKTYSWLQKDVCIIYLYIQANFCFKQYIVKKKKKNFNAYVSY